ncbi:hypothetical protein V6N11_073609 [Hibiscus sabdariffa]|uniref:Uncharacterized protein n=1 Tax=Hibiscus sabdariffa TaxID=183260 RepID=A0ABR2NTX0_9ROSI
MATIEVTKQRVRQPGNLKTQQPSVDHVKSLRYNVGLSGWCCDDENDESSRSYGCLVKMVKIRRINSIVERLTLFRFAAMSGGTVVSEALPSTANAKSISGFLV